MIIKKCALALCALTLVTACAKKDMGEDEALTGPNAKLMRELESKIGNKVYFAYDSSVISKEAATTLGGQSEFIKQHPDLNFIIEGHADERGTREYNLALGERRANAALKFLSRKGVDSNKLTVISYGKERPAVDGHDEEAWSKNRRAVTIIK